MQFKIIIDISLLILFIYMSHSFNNKSTIIYYNNKNSIEQEKIIANNIGNYKEYIFESLNESFKNSKSFLNKTLEGILINELDDFKLSEKPEVSAICPIFNSQNFITRTINSIQNQNLLNIEIILVNDFSTDNTLSIIDKLQRGDRRIKIINNKKNMGILYSRCIGTLSAKGKYIFSIDNDDMFLNSDVFSTVNKIANEGNFDIVEFKGILSKISDNILNSQIRDIHLSNKKLNLFIQQPELSDFPIKIGKNFGEFRLNSIYLWSKCIKTNIYQKAINKLGKEKYSRYMLIFEDLVAMIILFNTANSYKFIGKYGIFHFERRGSGGTLATKIQNNLMALYWIDVAINFSKNIIYRALNLKFLDKIIITSKKYREILFSCLNKVLNSDCYSLHLKKKITKKVQSLKFINYHFLKFI